MATVPLDHKEAALGLGATRWEMIRIAVLPYCRSGIVGGAMLGLGRAIGETIAVTILIGDAPQLGGHLFGQGYSLAAVDRERVRRGPGPAPLGAVRRRARAVRADPARQRRRAHASCCGPRNRARSKPRRSAPRRRPTRRRGGGRMSAQSAHTRRATGALQRQPRAPAAGPDRARHDPRGHGARADPAAADRLLPAAQGPVLVEPELLHDRPDRQHVLQELEHRRDQERDPRHDRDGRAGLARSRSRSASAWPCGSSSTARAAGSRSSCGSSSTSSRACRRSCSGCSSTSF